MADGPGVIAGKRTGSGRNRRSRAPTDGVRIDALLLLTLQVAFGIWGPNPVSDLIRPVVRWLPNAFVAIIIIVVAAAIAHAVRDLIRTALRALPYGRALAGAVSVVILAIGIIAALNQIGVAVTVTTPILIAVLATVAGILIVGVGGGLIQPMRERTELWLSRAETVPDDAVRPADATVPLPDTGTSDTVRIERRSPDHGPAQPTGSGNRW
jgi:hypothetical protein